MTPEAAVTAIDDFLIEMRREFDARTKRITSGLNVPAENQPAFMAGYTEGFLTRALASVLTERAVATLREVLKDRLEFIDSRDYNGWDGSN